MERIISLNKSWRFAVDNAAERKAASAKHQWKFRKVNISSFYRLKVPIPTPLQ